MHVALKSTKSNIPFDTLSYLKMISRRKFFVQNKTKQNEQRGRCNINPATTNHYYFSSDSAKDHSQPSIHAHFANPSSIHQYTFEKPTQHVINLQIIYINVKTTIPRYDPNSMPAKCIAVKHFLGL
jgi:hypothetical protein